MGSKAGPTPSAKDPREDEWRAESDHRTLMDAADIKGDAGRMAGVKQHHLKKKAQLGKVGRTLSGRR